jgi:hypothetical protein
MLSAFESSRIGLRRPPSAITRHRSSFVGPATISDDGRAWTSASAGKAEPLLSSKVDSWQTGVNRNVEGRTVRRVLGSGPDRPIPRCAVSGKTD